MSDALAALESAVNLAPDTIAADDDIMADIHEIVRISLRKIKEKIEHGNDAVQVATMMKFLPVITKVMQEQQDTSLEDMREEMRQMVIETYMA